MSRSEGQGLAHPDQARSHVVRCSGMFKAKQFFAQSWLLVYFISVAVLSAAAYLFFTKHYGVGEERDRAFFISLIVASELSYWLSRLCRRPREIGCPLSSSLLVLEQVVLALLVCGASLAFLVTSPDPKLGVLCLMGLSCFQLIFGRFSRSKVVEIFEIPAALFIVACAFWLMVLASYKDVHHWSFFLGPVYTVLDGGHLLWDVPSQYGFLNILSVVALSRVSGLSPEIAMCHLLVLFEALSLIVTFYIFRFRLGLSTFVAAAVATVFHFCLPGWIEMYSGPAYIPSSSAFRFFPSIAAIVSFDWVVRSPSRIGILLSAALIAVASHGAPKAASMWEFLLSPFSPLTL